MLHERAGVGIERAGDLLRAAGDAEHAEAGHRQQHDGRQQTGHTAPERVTRADAHGLFLRRSGDFGRIGFAGGGLAGRDFFRLRARFGRIGLRGVRRGVVVDDFFGGLVFVHDGLLS